MEVASRRKGKISRNGVVDEVKGGINVYSEKEETSQVENDEKISTTSGDNNNQVHKKLEMGPKPNVGVVGGGGVMSCKRKSWKSESNLEGKPIQIVKKRSELNKNLDEQSKELTTVISADNAMKKSPIQSKKCGTEKSPVKTMKAKFGESSDGNERNGIQLRKVKSEANKEGNEKNSELRKVKSVSLQMVKTKSASSKELEEEKCKNFEENKVVVDDVLDESKKNLEGSFEGNEKNCELRKVKSVCLDGNLRNSVEAKSEKCKKIFEENKVVVVDDVLDESKKNLEENEDGNEKNCELRKLKSVCLDGNLRDSLQMVKTRSEKCKNGFEENKVVVDDIIDESKRDLEGSFEGIQRKRSTEENCKEFDVCEEKVITTSNVESQVKSPLKEESNLESEEEEEEDQEDIDEKIEKGSVDVKEVAEQIFKPKKIVIEENNKVHISNNEKKQVPISPIIKKQPPPISGQSRIHHHHHHPSPTRTKPVPTSDEEFQSNIPRQHSNLQSFVDLIMWRDASKSALIFGFGTFVIISSSYTQDLNISFISVISYLGLVYLATIFLFRSLRGANDIGESSEYVLGEEEAVWVLKLILPYVNECLLKIRALFSGDPATTMKMAVLLFIFARCGSSITIWKMSKLGFFGVFIGPKVCSSYSTQLTAYGTFWIRRFRDAWVSCTHKKAFAFAIFTLIWNLSSISARIWTVFMLYVGFRYYQQKLMKEGWLGEDEITETEDYWQEKIERQKKIGRRSSLMESKKQKKTH
ncbi:reticulon-like protein B21 [Lycium ferocissimum]|uniref:reticulon-like protein B21 n=1 Tax=Lycium ferocissimum TaxID=112874 RepID=UPI0028151B50|nr:reticulon-like protein B21 [Lycium ferocissimum]